MKIRWIGAALAAMLALSACSLSSFGTGGSGENPAAGSTGPSAEEILTEEPLVAPAEDDGRTHIGILLYRGHGAAEETVSGFEEELQSLMGHSDVDFEVLDADGDADKCAQIATGFANSGYQLIFACGTEALQNAGAAVKDVPIVGACVTDFLLSETVSSLDAPGGNITGVSSMGPIDDQVDQAIQIASWPVMVGIITSGTEVGSQFQEGVAIQCLDESQVSWKTYHAASAEGLRKILDNAVSDGCTCFYLPTDSFVASHMDVVRDVMLETGVPVVTGDYQMCSAGGLCCRSIDYYEHGRKAAGMAYDILGKGEEISRMAIQEETEWLEYYSPTAAEQLEWYGYGNMIPLHSSEESEVSK